MASYFRTALFPAPSLNFPALPPRFFFLFFLCLFREEVGSFTASFKMKIITIWKGWKNQQASRHCICICIWECIGISYLYLVLGSCEDPSASASSAHNLTNGFSDFFPGLSCSFSTTRPTAFFFTLYFIIFFVFLVFGQLTSLDLLPLRSLPTSSGTAGHRPGDTFAIYSKCQDYFSINCKYIFLNEWPSVCNGIVRHCFVS